MELGRLALTRTGHGVVVLTRRFASPGACLLLIGTGQASLIPLRAGKFQLSGTDG
jgi:hypothetical protein